MAQVWKWLLEMTDENTIEMPEGASVLSVQVQHEHPCLWALVRPDAPRIQRRFRIVGTGHEFDPTGLTYVGTFQLYGGELVFHLFERGDGQ